MEVFDIALQSAVSFSEMEARSDTIALIAAVAKTAALLLDDYFAGIIASTQEKCVSRSTYLTMTDTHITPTVRLVSGDYEYASECFTFEG